SRRRTVARPEHDLVRRGRALEEQQAVAGAREVDQCFVVKFGQRVPAVAQYDRTTRRERVERRSGSSREATPRIDVAELLRLSVATSQAVQVTESAIGRPYRNQELPAVSGNAADSGLSQPHDGPGTLNGSVSFPEGSVQKVGEVGDAVENGDRVWRD